MLRLFAILRPIPLADDEKLYQDYQLRRDTVVSQKKRKARLLGERWAT